MNPKKKAKIIILVLGMMFAISTMSSFNISDDSEGNDKGIEIRDETNVKSPKTSGFWDLTGSPIFIEGDADYAGHNWSWVEDQIWFGGGDGSPGTPYIIENITIDGLNFESCIKIQDSVEYFTIRNCTVYNSEVGADYAGIYLNNTANGRLEDNNCSNNGEKGISLRYNCNNIIIRNNTINDNDVSGMRLRDNCYNNTISENTINNNELHGLRLWDGCDNNTISNNTANNNVGYGIRLSPDCDNNTISGNTASNDGTTNQNRGIGVENNCHDNTISGNTVNNNDDYGICVENNCNNNTISGNTASNVGTMYQRQGIRVVVGCDNNTISGNTANDNIQYGIILSNDANNNTISENYIYFNTIEAISITTANCYDNIIKKNVLVSADEQFISDDGTNTLIGCNLYLTSAPSLCVEVIAQSFSTTEFIIVLNISSGFNIFSDYDFDFTIESIQIWWNGTPVLSNKIVELGFGSYNISLTPKFVNPGEDPITLNMTITATHHGDKYFELKLAVDPKAVAPTPSPPSDGDDDDDDDEAEEPDVLLIFLITIGIASAIGIAGVAIFLIKKRRKLREETN